MPWKVSNHMDEKVKFIGRVLDGEKISDLCEEFGISRKTGYKIYERYKSCGLDGLSDRSRRPYRQANQLPYQVERSILGLKKEYPDGVPRNSGKSSSSATRRLRRQRSARFTLCWTDMASWRGGGAGVTKLKEQRSSRHINRTAYGVRITKVSSEWVTNDTVIL